jgi:hypothetical protein
MSTAERTRLTVELSGQLNDELERLAAETGKSKSELLRLGVDFLARAAAARRDGMLVGAWSDAGSAGIRREREFIGIS